MKVINSSKEFKQKKKSVIALGNFDGVHVGHRTLIEECKKLSDEKNCLSCVYTFYPHPARIIAPFGSPPLIQTIDQRINEISKYDIDYTIIEKFNKSLSNLTDEEYFNSVLLKLNPDTFIVGYDFTFGKDRMGNAIKLKKMAHDVGLNVIIIEPQFLDHILISSTIIRQLIAAGQIKDANELLGHNEIITGTIIQGEGKGRELGFPTANVMPNNELIPGPGVYITSTTIDAKQSFQSVTFTGPAATFGRHDFAIETHILDYDSSNDLTGVNVDVQFLARIRDVIKFKNETDLKTRINDDIQIAMKYYEENK